MTNKLLSLLAFLILLTTVDASVISTGVFNILKGTDPQNMVDITWELHSDDEEYKLYIINDGLEGVVTGVYFEETIGNIKTLGLLNNQPITFTPSNKTGKLKGGNSIDFTVYGTFKALRPKRLRGIDTGDSLGFSIENFDTLRIGVDVVGIHRRKVTYNTGTIMSSIPEPTTTTLLGLVGIGLILRRRKNE